MKLLIAEDEKDLAEALTVFFQRNRFSVDAVFDGADALEYARQGAYDGIILDVMMPKLSGLQVLQRLRQEGITTPVMMLTAAAEKDDRIAGFDAGADDYLPKPFAPDELLSRVRALLRRGGGYRSSSLSYHDVTLDCAACLLRRGDSSVRLSGREYQVLELLMRSPDTVFNADRIMEQVWGWDSEAEVSVVWVHISNIRKKLKSVGSEVNIRVIRGVGYALEVKTC